MQKRRGRRVRLPRRVYVKIAWLLAMLAATLVPAPAQRYRFRIFSEAQGLTDLGTTTLLQDRAGFVWVGTNNGLFRFDGHRFRRFGAADGLPAHAISALLETSDGSL
jgi:ligand-binding sensor domain-containing protein